MNEQPVQAPLKELEGVPDVWRDEVQARLERYKRRRGRRIEGAFTMRFPFPPEESSTLVLTDESREAAIEDIEPAGVSDVAVVQDAAAWPTPEKLEEPHEVIPVEQQKNHADEAVFSPATSAAPMKDPEPEEPAQFIELRPRPLPRRKVIAFPSPPHTQTEFTRRIADPVQPEQLRIVEVPEELQAIPATPFLEGLLDAPPASAPELRADAVELPCPILGASRRISAAAIDLAVTLAGAGLFAAAAARFLSELPPVKFLIAGALAVCVLLWVIYEYLFLVYGGRTPGMAVTRVTLQTFKGQFPEFRRRQLRVVGMYLSVLSLGMGVLWYFVDVESLCWHDRISQSFPASADNS